MEMEKAIQIILEWVRRGRPTRASNYGYDIYLPNVMRDYISPAGGRPGRAGGEEMESLSPDFYAAAWELCRKGIIRPGIRVWGAEATKNGSDGNGYSLTPFGRQWVDSWDGDDASLRIMLAELAPASPGTK